GANYYRPSDVANAYNLTGLYKAGLHGEGQTVGLFELDDYSINDINTYTAACGGGSVPITRIPVNGGTTAGDGAFEVAMDMELVLSAAPHLANLRVYESANNASWQSNSLLIWGQIVNDSVPVVSTSWGICEPFLSAGIAQQE